MSDTVATHDSSKQRQPQAPENIGPRPPLSEILCPQRLSDLTLPAPIIERLQKMVETKSLMHMMFYGKVGTGKTSATSLFEDCAQVTPFGRESVLWDGSRLQNADFVRTNILGCLSNAGFRIFVLDRADVVPKAAQQVLPSVMDGHMHHSRYIFTVNDRSKIIPEIQSRLMPICFDIERSDRAEVQERLIGRYERKLAEYGIRYDKQRLNEIIRTSYPDLRSIAQKLEFEFA
jgi:DNA polymerase III delta prime subunit